MQLPDFIKRMLGFADKVESHFTATEQLALAQARIATLEKELTDLKASAADGEVKIKNLSADITAKVTEIANLQTQVATEKRRGNEVIASQGLSLEQVPATTPNTAATTAPKETLWAQYQRLAAENPRAAGELWALHADEILKSRPQQQ